MKEKVLIILLFIGISSSNLFAITAEEFADNVAYTIFKTAWPTAKYKDTKVLQQQRTSDGYVFIFKFNGNSRMCLIGDCPLWFKLKINLDYNFHVENMEVLDYQSLIAKPFQTAGSMAVAITESNNKWLYNYHQIDLKLFFYLITFKSILLLIFILNELILGTALQR